ncbi:MAG: hypothetical protein VB021_07495 [Oscillospiraceae bacterium]|nr:hypothetical protein [Oscillospiraceae bacterium]
MSDFMKKKKFYLLFPAVAVIASVVLFFALGFAPDRFTDGCTVYSAALDSAVEIDSVDTDALYEDVKTALGRDADVFAGYNYGTYLNELTITVRRGDTIDEQAVVDMLADKYPDFKIESLNSETYSGANGSAYYRSTAVIIGIVTLVCLLVSALICGFGTAFEILLGAIGSVGIVTLVYLLARIAHFRLYAAAVVLCIVLTFAFGSVRCVSLNRHLRSMKKPVRDEAADAVSAKNDGACVTALILAFIFAVCFAAAGFITGGLQFAYIGVMLFASALAVAACAARFVPALWTLSK